MMRKDIILDQKLLKYFSLTKKALDKVRISPSKKLEKMDEKKLKEIGNDFFDMANRYYLDADYFRKKGDIVTAFAALNYAHGWLDAGARLGLFDVDKDNSLFAIDDEDEE